MKATRTRTPDRRTQTEAHVRHFVGEWSALDVRAFWQRHPLVTEHGCEPEAAHRAGRSAFAASARLATGRALADPIATAEAWALRRYARGLGALSARVRRLADDLADLEKHGWKATPAQLADRIARAARRRAKVALHSAFEGWLVENWTEGRRACLLNARGIAEAFEATFRKFDDALDDSRVRQTLHRLRLVRPRRVGRRL